MRIDLSLFIDASSNHRSGQEGTRSSSSRPPQELWREDEGTLQAEVELSGIHHVGPGQAGEQRAPLLSPPPPCSAMSFQPNYSYNSATGDSPLCQESVSGGVDRRTPFLNSTTRVHPYTHNENHHSAQRRAEYLASTGPPSLGLRPSTFREEMGYERPGTSENTLAATRAGTGVPGRPPLGDLSTARSAISSNNTDNEQRHLMYGDAASFGPQSHARDLRHVDRIANELKITDTAQRNFLYDVAEWSPTQAIPYVAATQRMMTNMLVCMQESQRKLEHDMELVKRTIAIEWEPQPGLRDALVKVYQHFLVAPRNTYEDISERAIDFVEANLARFQIDYIYNYHPTIKEKVQDFITSSATEIRSSFRKVLFKSIEAGQEIPLEEFTQYILKDYEAYGTRDVTNQRKATFALMRKVAHPLLRPKNNEGGTDRTRYNFYENLEIVLDELVEAHGDNRTDRAWQVWELDIIKDDEAKFVGQAKVQRPRRKGRNTRDPTGLIVNEPARPPDA